MVVKPLTSAEKARAIVAEYDMEILRNPARATPPHSKTAARSKGRACAGSGFESLRAMRPSHRLPSS